MQTTNPTAQATIRRTVALRASCLRDRNRHARGEPHLTRVDDAGTAPVDFSYDERDRLVRREADGVVDLFAWTASDQIHQHTDPRGKVSTTDYDRFDRPRCPATPTSMK